MAHYAGDPRWITARFESKCVKCSTVITKGSEIYYYPNGKRAYCPTCGRLAEADFESCKADEESCYGGQVDIYL